MPGEPDQLKNLKSAAELHIHFSDLNLRMLRNMTSKSEKTVYPWKSLREGSYYLGNAYRLVELYKDYASGSIDNTDLKAVCEMLVTLEFEPEHITYGYTDEAYAGKDKCFISKGQGTKYYNLLHSKSKKSVKSFIEMVERGIDVPVKRFLESINQKLETVVLNENLLKAVKNNNCVEVENCVKKQIDVNFKDADGKTPLHYAVTNDNVNIAEILLKNEADVTQITKEGKTLLHITTSKGNEGVVEILLQYVKPDKSTDFIDAKITDGTTSLHVAAMNGFLDIIKTLLKHGATYDIKNNEDKSPVDVSENQNVINLLKLVKDLFADAKNDNLDIISKLKAVESDEFAAVTNTRNNQGNTLLQVAVANKELKVAEKLLEMIKNQLRPSFECELDQLKSLKGSAELHMEFSNIYLPMLRGMSQQYPSQPDNNICPWKTLKDGSYFLGNADSLIEKYKKCSIYDENLNIVNDTLVNLQFDPEHISSGYTDEAYGGKAECFVSKGQGTKYYNLLHSKLKKDVRLFIAIAEKDIDEPVKRFLESIEDRLQ